MRLAWVWVLLAIVAFLGVMFVTSIVVFVHAVEPPVDAMNHFLAAVDHRDYATAYALLCRDEQRTTSRDEFPTAIAPFANDLSEYDVYSFDPIGHDRSVQYTVKRVDGHKRTYRATMVREDGAWRVCDFFDERS
jgi:hypothetical protein